MPHLRPVSLSVRENARRESLPSVRQLRGNLGRHPDLLLGPRSWHDRGVLASNGPDDRFRSDRSGDPRAALGRPSVPGPGGPGPSMGPGGPGTLGAVRAPRGKGGPPGLRGGPGGRGRPGERPGRVRRKSGPPPEPLVPVRKALSLLIGGFALLLAFG